MSVRVRVFALSLEVFAAAEARVHIEVTQRNRTQLLEVEVEQVPLNRAEVRAIRFLGTFRRLRGIAVEGSNVEISLALFRGRIGLL